MENLNTSSLPNGRMLCPRQEEGAEEDLGRGSGPMTSSVRENRTQADRLRCTWMTLSPQRVKKWSLKTESPHQSGPSKFHRRFLLGVDFQATEEDVVPFIVRIDFSHHLLQKVDYLYFLMSQITEMLDTDKQFF